jgi:histidine phosphotransferase ChpT
MKINIAELVATRICHDLAGPIGAINNGLDMLGDKTLSHDFIEQARSMLMDSSNEMLSRLTFFRLAFGRINENHAMEWSEFEKTLNDYLGKKYSLKIVRTSTSKNIPNLQKHIALGVMCILMELIWGGEIEIEIAEQTKISGKNERRKTDEELRDVFAGNISDRLFSPHLAPALLLKELYPAAKYDNEGNILI